MLDISLYSNDSQFLVEFVRGLSSHLGGYAKDVCRFRSFPLFQTSLYDGLEAPPDLCVVDIRDEPERALDFAERLRKRGDTEVMLVASGPDWAMRAYDLDIISYLLDPPDTKRAAEVILRRFSRDFRPQSAQFPFRTSGGVQVLSAERIVYVEYSDHRLLVHTDLGKRIATTTMRCSFGEAAAQLLADPRFVRTHASFLVNITHVARFGQYMLTMDSGAAVPVSHAKKAEVKRRFNEFFSIHRP